MPARLTIHFSAAPARELILPEGHETVVGRDPECGVVIADDRVSRRHAALAPGPAGWTVTDLDSKNGTQVDGLPVATGSLAGPSWISFGGLIARFETLDGPAEKFHEQRLRRLTTALEVRRGLVPEAGLGELLSRVVASMLALTGAERGFLLLVGEDGGLEVAARSGLSWDDLRAAEFGGSAGAVEQALAGGRPVVRADVRADAELGARASVVAGGIRALLCVPVPALDRQLGVMYADSRRPGAAFTELDLEILEALAAQAGLAIAVARLDGELRGLAARLSQNAAEEEGTALRSRLAGQITAALDRALPAAPAAGVTRAFADTWHGLLAAQAPLGAPS